MNILVTNLYNVFNLGSYHDLLLAKKLFPYSKFYVLSFPIFYKKIKDVKLLSPSIKGNFFIGAIKYLMSIILKRKDIIKCDFVVDLAGDYLNDVNYSIFHPLLYFLNLLPAILYKKKL